MKRLLMLFCAGALISTLGVACDDESNEDGIDVPFAEYSLDETSSEWANLGYGEDYFKGRLLVINSEEELESHIMGTDYSAVDFSEKTLLLAYGVESHVVYLKGCEFHQVSEQKYAMDVNLQHTIASAITEWQAAIVVDKLSEESKVKLNVVDKL